MGECKMTILLIILGFYYAGIIIAIVTDMILYGSSGVYTYESRVFNSKTTFLVGLLPFGWVFIWLVKYFISIGKE
jgi:hypothetical protein